jgi:hypothetical protein
LNAFEVVLKYIVPVDADGSDERSGVSRFPVNFGIGPQYRGF